MGDLGPLGRVFIWMGIFFLVLGGICLLGGKLSWLGKLPGDIYIHRKNFHFYFPLATSIVLSLLLSLILTLFFRR